MTAVILSVLRSVFVAISVTLVVVALAYFLITAAVFLCYATGLEGCGRKATKTREDFTRRVKKAIEAIKIGKERK